MSIDAYVQELVACHPGVHFVLGQKQSGKTMLMQNVLARWPGNTLAIDSVCTNPPQAKHLARYATAWCEEPPPRILPWVSLVASDECADYTKDMPSDSFMFQMVRRGQHQLPHGVTSLLGSQRPMDIGPDAWSQANTMAIGRVYGQSDLQRIAKLPGMRQEVVAWLPQLLPGEFVIWFQDGRLQLPRRIREAT